MWAHVFSLPHNYTPDGNFTDYCSALSLVLLFSWWLRTNSLRDGCLWAWLPNLKWITLAKIQALYLLLFSNTCKSCQMCCWKGTLSTKLSLNMYEWTIYEKWHRYVVTPTGQTSAHGKKLKIGMQIALPTSSLRQYPEHKLVVSKIKNFL